MAFQLSGAVRDAALDSIETTIGTAAKLEIRTGSPPANCAAASTGTVLASMTLPSDWMAASSGGSKAKSGTWQDSSADATGTAAHFRIFDNAGTTCHIQGTVGTSGADLIVDSVSFTSGQTFTVTSFQINIGNG